MHELNSKQNPFAVWVEAGAVTDPDMFYGREPVLSHIQEALYSARSKCFILYGQKRSGKSSVLFHLQLRLEDSSKFLCVRFSVGKIMAEILETEPTRVLPQFYYYIAANLKNRLDNIADEGRAVPKFRLPSRNEFYESGIMLFEEVVREFNAGCQDCEGWGDRKLLLMLDEFTYLYKPMKDGLIGRSFLQAWKSMIDDNLFSAVVVGQDVMRNFMDEYANELASSKSYQLDYLSNEDSSRLIDEPMKIGGKDGLSRLKGRVKERVFELTAGNPYYVQIVGHRLFDVMKRERLRDSSTVELSEVVEQLTRSVDALAPKHFNNLVTASDDDMTDIKPHETWSVLRALAIACPDGGSCSRTSIRLSDSERVEQDTRRIGRPKGARDPPRRLLQDPGRPVS